MKECGNICDLKSCYLCSRCLPGWLPAVAQAKKNYQVKKGQSVFAEGNEVKGIFFIYSGVVKVHKYWDSEKELITRFAKEGDIIGHLGLGKNPVYPVSATALTPCIVCFIEMDFFNATIQVNTALTCELMRFFANELQESQMRMNNLAHMSVKARISKAFLSLKEQFGTNTGGIIPIELSRQDIASYAGTTYETLYKVINELSKQNCIEMIGKQIRIADEHKLAKIVLDDNSKSN